MSTAMAVELARALIIWTTMSDRLQHTIERALRQLPLRPRNPPRDSAHVDLWSDDLPYGLVAARIPFKAHNS